MNKLFVVLVILAIGFAELLAVIDCQIHPAIYRYQLSLPWNHDKNYLNPPDDHVGVWKCWNRQRRLVREYIISGDGQRTVKDFNHKGEVVRRRETNLQPAVFGHVNADYRYSNGTLTELVRHSVDDHRFHWGDYDKLVWRYKDNGDLRRIEHAQMCIENEQSGQLKRTNVIYVYVPKDGIDRREEFGLPIQ